MTSTEPVQQKNISSDADLFPDWITYQNDMLHLEGVACDRFVREFGTPVTIFSGNRLASNADAIRNAFRTYNPDAVIAYAYKVCYLREIANIFVKQNLYAEVMSRLEYDLATNAGFPPEQTIINGIGKTEQEIRRVLGGNTFLINADSISDLKQVNQVASDLGICARVGIRVSPSADDPTFRIAGKLGSDIDAGDAIRVIRAARDMPHIDLAGLHVHSYSRETTPELHRQVSEKMRDFISELSDSEDILFRLVDIGGGFSSRYTMERQGYSIEDFARNIAVPLTFPDHSPRLVVEPGTFLVCDAAITLTRVLAEKTNAGKKWLIIDAGTNVLSPFPGNYEVHPMIGSASSSVCHFGVSDGLCTPLMIQEEAVLPDTIKQGDVLAVLNCGAYTISSGANWGYPLWPVILLNDGQTEVIFGAEHVAKLIKIMYGQNHTLRGDH